MLSKKALRDIGTWIQKNGKPLEAARFAYLFEGAPAAAVLDCLKTYQNADGGFGHGLEPDCQNVNSSPLATSVALQIMFEAGFRRRNEMIDGCLRYLAHNHYDGQSGTWATILPTNNDYPHAPWWTWEKDGRNTWDFNPSAELAGFVWYYAEPDSAEAQLAAHSLRQAQKHLLAVGEGKTLDFHELFCYVNGWTLVRMKGGVDAFDPERTEQAIAAQVERAMCRDREKWLTDYIAHPVDFMNALNVDDLPALSAFSGDFSDNAAALVGALPQGGVWDVSWTWGGLYGDAFERIRPHWQAVMALKRLAKFRRLGLIEA